MSGKLLKYGLIAPSLAVIIATTLYPMVYALLTSFRYWSLSKSLSPGSFVGLQNYTRAFSDPYFLNSIVVTLKFVLISVSMSIFFALLIALLLNRSGKLETLTKSLLLFPFAMAPALKGYTWRFLLDGSFGMLDHAIDFLFPPLSDVIWLASPNWALFWLAITEVWGWTPYLALVFIGALATMSTEIIEAAQVDGANKFQVFWYIILPTLKPVLLVMVLFKTIYSLKMFDQVVTMTGGGPGRATETINFIIYRTAFKTFDMGYASAQAYILVVIQLLFALFYVRALLRIGSRGER